MAMDNKTQSKSNLGFQMLGQILLSEVTEQ